MIYVTSGSPYIDIDAYACIVSYTNLLRATGLQAISYSSSKINHSITSSLLSICNIFGNESFTSNDDFIIVDVSNPSFFDKKINGKRVIEIIDHHHGFKSLWDNVLGEKSVIEYVGAAATLVLEKWIFANLLNHITRNDASLLCYAIIDNTVGLASSNTTERDVKAFNILLPIAELDSGWDLNYFNERQQYIERNFESAIDNDTKKYIKPYIDAVPAYVSQLIVADPLRFLSQNPVLIEEVMGRYGDDWVLSLLSSLENLTVLYSPHHVSKQKIERLLDINFSGDIYIFDEIILRKDLFKF